MRLRTVHIKNFKCIDDSTQVEIDNITCLVGKNEAGKTAFLQAIRKLNPEDGLDSDYDELEYPRKGLTSYRRIQEENPAVVVIAEFDLSDDEISTIESEFGEGVVKSKKIIVEKNYKNDMSFSVEINEKAYLTKILSSADLPQDIMDINQDLSSCEELFTTLESLEEKSDTIVQFITQLKENNKTSLMSKIINNYLVKFVPIFVYFADYNIMKGKVSLQYLQQRENEGKLDEGERTLLSLLALAGTGLDEFISESNYERIKAELEAASISITNEVFEFWSQNTSLKVHFDRSATSPQDIAPHNQGTIFHVRIFNEKHQVSVPFDERSKGFVWFFSFLVYFSQIEKHDRDLVLLLDEPGLNLHAKAQEDLLRFIDERLIPKHQVIYTTHSPFMIHPSHLERVRTVQALDDRGTIVSDDVLRNDKATIFPLQAALGYELAQTLFVSPNNLLVEGPSDLVYLPLLSDVVAISGEESLDPRWTVVPIGGADKVSTFVSLLGANKLNIVVLIDASSKDMQRIRNLQENRFLGNKNLILFNEFTNKKNSDIEDLFEPDFYLKLVNGSYSEILTTPLTIGDFQTKHPRIVKRVEAYFEQNGLGNFSHLRPASYFLKEQAQLINDIDDETKKRVVAMFKRVNELIE